MAGLSPLILQSFTSALVGILVWLTIKRSVERRDDEVDTLRREVNVLKEQKIFDIEKRLDGAAKSRGGMHKDIELVQREYISKSDCEKKHNKMDDQVKRIESVAVDLARVEEGNKQTAATVRQTSEQLIAFGQDLARLEGRMKKT